ncbi:leucine-rich repeat domain-containing protein [Aquimarina sediminis]|uniref:leucine-rich repeat domain-containing protein n=1 Tax=Aquimarina sediminis TaxID=2070536 RepID=UPI000CA058BC|nr:DUF5018 domain-containing protein [Aquimarina sediminis]
MKIYIHNNLYIVIYLLMTFCIISCSKDDEPVPAEILKSNAKQITSFVFLLTDNPINVNVVATIDEENKTIVATMPVGTDVTGLLPEIKTSTLATVNPDTAKDFTNPVEYIVTAEDGSEAIYTVTINVLLSQRQVLQAILDANPASSLDWDLQTTTDLGDLNGVVTNTESEIIELSINSSNISELPPEIGFLKKLNFLDVSSNTITVLPNEMTLLSNLSELRLRRNHIEALPLEIGKLAKLEKLNISQNKLTLLSPEIGKLNKLTMLNAGNNSLTILPNEIGQLINLEELYLEDNILTSFPEEFGQLTNISKLRIGGDTFSAFPLEILQLTKLEELGIYATRINALPPEIGTLSNLTSLELIGNEQLTAIPPEIGFLSSLKKLSYYDLFEISTLPQSVCNLITYNGLGIFYSPIPGSEYHYCETVSPKDVLISIYTANPGNTLEWSVDNYPEVTFHTNGNPKTITMNNKSITRIPDNIDQLTGLESLNVNSNNLEVIPSSIGNMNTLGALTLANNQLSTVPSELGQLTGLALLSLTNNPISSIPAEVCDLQTSNGGILTILTDSGEGCN